MRHTNEIKLWKISETPAVVGLGPGNEMTVTM